MHRLECVGCRIQGDNGLRFENYGVTFVYIAQGVEFIVYRLGCRVQVDHLFVGVVEGAWLRLNVSGKVDDRRSLHPRTSSGSSPRSQNSAGDTMNRS